MKNLRPAYLSSEVSLTSLAYVLARTKEGWSGMWEPSVKLANPRGCLDTKELNSS
jgi:hypothetical protein